MRTCIDNRKRKVFNDIKHLSTKAVLLIIFLSLLPALQVMAMETPDETQQKSTIRVQGRVSAMLSESHTVWVPTLVTVRNLLGDGRYADETLRPIIETAEENVRKAFGLGVKVAPGSDAVMHVYICKHRTHY